MLILISSTAEVVKHIKLNARRHKRPFTSLECGLPKAAAYSGFREDCMLISAPHDSIGLVCSFFAGRLAERYPAGEQEHQWLYIDAVGGAAVAAGSSSGTGSTGGGGTGSTGSGGTGSTGGGGNGSTGSSGTGSTGGGGTGSTGGGGTGSTGGGGTGSTGGGGNAAGLACIVNSIAGEWLPDILVSPAQFGWKEAALQWSDLSPGAAQFARDSGRLFAPHRIAIALLDTSLAGVDTANADAGQSLESLIDFGLALAGAGRLPDLGVDARDRREIVQLSATARLTRSEQQILTTRLNEMRVRSGSHDVRLAQLCSLTDWPSKREDRDMQLAELLRQLQGEL